MLFNLITNVMTDSNQQTLRSNEFKASFEDKAAFSQSGKTFEDRRTVALASKYLRLLPWKFVFVLEKTVV